MKGLIILVLLSFGVLGGLAQATTKACLSTKGTPICFEQFTMPADMGGFLTVGIALPESERIRNFGHIVSRDEVLVHMSFFLPYGFAAMSTSSGEQPLAIAVWEIGCSTGQKRALSGGPGATLMDGDDQLLLTLGQILSNGSLITTAPPALKITVSPMSTMSDTAIDVVFGCQSCLLPGSSLSSTIFDTTQSSMVVQGIIADAMPFSTNGITSDAVMSLSGDISIQSFSIDLQAARMPDYLGMLEAAGIDHSP